MISLNLLQQGRTPGKILCIGAHSDDIEIGCGGTILHLLERYQTCELYWVVFSAIGAREEEARNSVRLFGGDRIKGLVLKPFQDGFMPFAGAEVKTIFEKELKPIAPDIIFTHNDKDAHQDHRLLSQLTWNTFRNHLILEYEIPKYDGDLGRPGVFLPLAKELCERKVQGLMKAFATQRPKHWFDPETFLALMRLRGMECAAPSGYAEAFYCRKLVVG